MSTGQSVAVPELSIIIVNWNGGDLLTHCVESIVTSRTQAPFEVIIVDNASTDDSLARLQASATSASLLSKGQLRIIRNSENVGFGRANNQAFALTDSRFVFLLNPDAEVAPDAINVLLDTINSDTKIGGCGPKILNADGSTQTSVFFNPPCAWHTFLWQLKLYSLLPRSIRGEILLGRHWSHNHKRDVPMLIGAALLLRRDVIEQVGGFNEDFHMYGEDNELCWRIARAGWRLIFEPAAVVVHHGGVSATKRWSPMEQLRVKLEAGFRFEQLALTRRGLIANQLANYLVVSAQVGARRILGARRIPGLEFAELALIKTIHRQNLKRSFGHQNRDGPKHKESDRTHRGMSA